MEPVFAKAVVIDDGEQMIAMVALDTVGIDQQETASIRKRVSEYTGISEQNIMVSATHNHRSGPVYVLDRTPEEAQYIDYLVLKAADAVAIAFQERQPARIGIGIGKEEDISFNRRFFLKDGTVKTHGFGNPNVVKPAGPIDPDVMVVRIDDLAGHPIGIITNFACHLDTVGGSEFCPDYPAELSRVLRGVLGQHIISFFSTGACGNINHVDVTQSERTDKTHYIKMGRILAGEVLKVREKIEPAASVKVRALSEKFIAETRKPSKAEIEAGQAILKQVEEGNHQFNQNDIYFAKQPQLLHDLNLFTQEMEVQTFRIGELAWSSFPGELFVEFGLELKERSASSYTMVQTYTNGISGYIVTDEAFKQGGYETFLSNRSRHYPETGYRMVDIAVEHINNLFR